MCIRDRRSDSASKYCFQAGLVWPYKSPQKLSFISCRKCWNCSLIGVTFAMGVSLLFLGGFRLSGQSQLTPSRFLHNRIYVTSFPIQDEPEGGGSFQYKMSLERMA